MRKINQVYKIFDIPNLKMVLPEPAGENVNNI